MSNQGKLSRRQFLKLAASSTAGAIVANSIFLSDTSGGKVSAQDMMYSDAPMLADMGLPPVNERLPLNPRVVPVRNEIGQYGGTWRRAFGGVSDMQGPVKLIYTFGLHFDISDDLKTIDLVPGLYDEWTQNDDASEYSFHIREGMRWSDGELFDTDDVQFWYDWFYIGELGPDYGTLNFNDTPMELEVVDQYTFIVRFPVSNPLLPLSIARDDTEGPRGGPTMAVPSHYFSKYIPELGDQALIDAAMEQYQVETWQELIGAGGNRQGPIGWWAMNAEIPGMNPWIMESPLPFNDPIVLVRNPYYYCVDAEGQQLPYIDRINHRLFGDNALFDLWITLGEIDMHERHVSAANFTLYKENESDGDYSVFLWKGASTNAYFPNTSHDDPVLHELFNDPRFRQALSISINREDINQIAYNGLYKPRQASPVLGSPQYDEEFEQKWVEYDPESAIALLDEIGLPLGNDGKRTRPDGSPLNIFLLHSRIGEQATLDEITLVVTYWNAIGLNVREDGVERSLYEERVDNNQVDIGFWGLDRSLFIEADPQAYIGGSGQQSYAVRYRQWYLGDENGVEPPEDHPIRRLRALWDQISTEPDEATRAELMKELINVHKEAPLAIGTVGEPPAPVIVSNRMHNVPNGIVSDTTLRNVRVANPEQFYLTEE